MTVNEKTEPNQNERRKSITAAAINDAYIPSAKDQAILDTPEHLFQNLTWKDIRSIITENRLEDLKRRPNDLRRYLIWGQETRQKYGTILNFMLKERLHWEEGFVAKNPIPFADPDDTNILFNDWPYGLEPGIVHIVVWTKANIDVDDVLGDLTPESRKLIVDYIQREFVDGLGLPEENVQWFKNPVALQSVRTVPHIHVLVDTNGVEGAQEKLGRITS